MPTLSSLAVRRFLSQTKTESFRSVAGPDKVLVYRCESDKAIIYLFPDRSCVMTLGRGRGHKIYMIRPYRREPYIRSDR